MKLQPALSRLVVALSVLALTLCLGCSKPIGEPPVAEPAAGPTTEPTDEPAPTDNGKPADDTVTIIEGTPLLWFVDTADVAQLRSDMSNGIIPTSCNVLYDQNGSLPDVTVTDPDTIKQIYGLVEGMLVPESGRGMSVTDSYHHVIFTLQGGATVTFNFEGIHNLYWGGKDYPVVNDDELWALVRQLQDEQMAGNAAN